MKIVTNLMAGAAFAAIGCAGIRGAHAQGAVAAEIDSITVTARGRSEAIEDIPVQISVYSRQDIIDAGIRTSQDFVNLTPNVTLDDSYTYLNSFVTIRGVSQINGGDPPIAVVVDGVPQNQQRQFKQNLFDVERIEVLRGPQGAFYGRNAVGGAINIVTRQPTNEFEGFVSASYAAGDALEFASAISGPIIEDKAYFRAAGSYKQDGGRIENVFLRENVDWVDHDYNIRGKLLLLPTDRITVDIRAAYNEFEAGAIADSFVESGDANDFAPPTSNILGQSDGEIFEGTVKADVEFDFATLTMIFGYADLREDAVGDLDFSNVIENPLGAFGLGQVGQSADLDVTLISQELRLVSPDDQRLRWIAGAYYLHTDRRLNTDLFIDVDGSVGQADNAAQNFLSQQEVNDNEAWSVFGQVEFDLTDRLTLSGALRYDEDRRFQRNALTGAARNNGFEAFQPTVAASYDVNENARLYASYAEGFRSGGFNAPGIAPFRDERVRTAEAGFKSHWFDRRLSIDSAVYYSLIDDFQFFFVNLEAGGQVISNIDEVEISGVELEMQAVLLQGVSVFAAIGTTDSEIVENQALPASVGNKTPRTTEWTFNIGAQLRRPIVDDVFVFFRLDYERRGEKYWQVDNLDVQGPVNLIGFRAGFETDRWGVYAWGRNITGDEFFTDFNPDEFSGLGFDIGFLGQPAIFGAEARIQF